MVFQCINIRQVSREMLKTEAFGLDFQHLPRDLANVNAWKNMSGPYIHLSVPRWDCVLSDCIYPYILAVQNAPSDDGD